MTEETDSLEKQARTSRGIWFGYKKNPMVSEKWVPLVAAQKLSKELKAEKETRIHYANKSYDLEQELKLLKQKIQEFQIKFLRAHSFKGKTELEHELELLLEQTKP